MIMTFDAFESYIGPSSGVAALWAVGRTQNHFRTRGWLLKSIQKPWSTGKTLRQCISATIYPPFEKQSRAIVDMKKDHTLVRC